MITEEMRSKWREDFENFFVDNYPYDISREALLAYGVFRRSGEIYTYFETEQMWKGYLAAKESSQGEIDELKRELESYPSPTDLRRAYAVQNREITERNELIKEAVVYVEAIRAINNLPGYRVGDGEKQFKEWLSKAKTILGEK